MDCRHKPGNEKSRCRPRRLSFSGIEQLADFLRKILLGEGLVQEMNVGVEASLVHDGISRVAGGE
jgi:hypothetical protein